MPPKHTGIDKCSKKPANEAGTRRTIIRCRRLDRDPFIFLFVCPISELFVLGVKDIAPSRLSFIILSWFTKFLQVLEASACDDVLRPLARTGEWKGQVRIISSTISNGLVRLKMLKKADPAPTLSLLHTSAFPYLASKTLYSYLSSPVLIIPQCPGYLMPSTELPDNWISAALAPELPAQNRNHLLGTTLHNTSSVVAGNLSVSTATKQDRIGHPRQTTAFATFVFLVRKFSTSLSDTFQNFITLCQEVVPLANFSLACGTLSPTSLFPTEMENN